MGRIENPSDSHPRSSIFTQVEEVGKQLPKKTKILTVIVIFYGNIAFACAYNTYGPVITSLQNKYDTNDAGISKVFTILTTCYLIGALVGGILYNYVNRQLAVVTILGIMSGVMFVTPHCPNLTTFFVSAAAMGLCCGCFDTANFVWILEMMQKDCPPYVQGQHFFYAVGTNLAALIMAPFLDEEDEDDTTTTAGTTDSFVLNDTRIVSSESEEDESSKTDKLFIPYTIVGLIVAAASLSQLFLFIFFRYFRPPPEVSEPDAEGSINTEKASGNEISFTSDKPFIGSWSWPKLRMVILSCGCFAAYMGMEMCTFQLFSKFAQNSDLDLSESQAAYVLTGMTAAYAAGRALAIVIVFKVAIHYLICANIAVCFVANVLLVGWAVRSLPVLWASSILFGIGFSSMYGSFAAFLERFLNFTDFIGSLMLIVGSGFAAIYPLIVGFFIDTHPVVLSYVIFCSITILILSFGGILFLTNKNKTRY